MDLRELPPLQELLKDGGRPLINQIFKEMPYKEYLQTGHWQGIRKMAWRRYHGQCVIADGACEGPKDVHHKNYDSIGEETENDVVLLCRRHHSMVHEAEKAQIRSISERQFRS